MRSSTFLSPKRAGQRPAPTSLLFPPGGSLTRPSRRAAPSLPFPPRGYTILELLVAMLLLGMMIAPILITFQTSERMSRRAEREFHAQVLAKEMMAEISRRPFRDPDGEGTVGADLLSPTHEEALADGVAPVLQNGTDETTNVPRWVNATRTDRRTYFDDMDDYDGYNSNEVLLPTRENGEEILNDGENIYRDYRVKVKVDDSSPSYSHPKKISGEVLGADLQSIAVLQGRYCGVLDVDQDRMAIIDLITETEIDCNLSVAGLNRIKLGYRSELPGYTRRLLCEPNGSEFWPLKGLPVKMSEYDMVSSLSRVYINTHDPQVANAPVNWLRTIYSNRMLSNTVRKTNDSGVGLWGGGWINSCLKNSITSNNRTLLEDYTDHYDLSACLYKNMPVSGIGMTDAISCSNSDNLIASENGTIIKVDKYGNEIELMGPVAGNPVMSIALTSIQRVYAGTSNGLYYSDDLMIENMGSPHWTKVTTCPNEPIRALTIDKSRTLRSGWQGIMKRSENPEPGLPFSPTMVRNINGVHLFFLDDKEDGGNGSAPTHPKLYYCRFDVNKEKWSVPKRVCSTPTGKDTWAHSVVTSDDSNLHVVYLSNRSGKWKVYYQRSSDGGNTWLPQDVCIGNEDGQLTIDDQSFKAAIWDWSRYAGDKFRHIAVSEYNRVWVMFSDHTGGDHHVLKWSNDGGIHWPPDNLLDIPKNQPDERVESIDFNPAENRLYVLLITGSEASQRRMFRVNPQTLEREWIDSFALNDRLDSMPPSVNNYGEWSYYSVGPHIDTPDVIGRLERLCGYFPLGNFSQQKLQRKFLGNPVKTRMLFQPNSGKDHGYLLFSCGMYNFPEAVIARIDPPNCLGNGSFTWIDDWFGAYDIVSGINCNNQWLLVKQDGKPSPEKDLKWAVFAEETLLVACANTLLIGNARSEQPAFESVRIPEEQILSLATDDAGRVMIGTNRSCYYRNFSKPNVWISTTGISAGVMDYPAYFERNGFKVGWRKFFNGRRITAVHCNRKGQLQVGTAYNGVYFSLDDGYDWKQECANFEGILDADFGKDLSLNYISQTNLVRHTDNMPMTETTAWRYHFLSDSNQRLAEPYRVAADSDWKPSKTVPCAIDSKNSKVAWYDNGLITERQTIERGFYVRGNHVEGVTTSGFNVKGELTHTGMYVDSSMTVEIMANGRYMFTGYSYDGLVGPDGFQSNVEYPSGEYEYDYYRQSPFAALHANIGTQDVEIGQFNVFQPPDSGELTLQLKGVMRSAQGECETTVRVIHPKRSHANTAGLNITALCFPPDGSVLYGIDESSGMAFLFTGLDDPSQTAAHVLLDGASAFQKFLFPPKENGFSVMVVTANRILNENGEDIFPPWDGIDIRDADLLSNGDIIFVDQKTQALYRCKLSSQRDVRVSVVDRSGSLTGSIPELTLCKRLFANLNQISERRSDVYQAIYTSRDYPGGVSAGKSVIWNSRESSGVRNCYIVDSEFSIAGSLKVNPGCHIRMVSPLGPATGKNGGYFHVLSGGALEFAGGILPYNNVVITPLSYEKVNPAIFTAPYGTIYSADELPNTLTYRNRWGAVDSTEVTMLGGIVRDNGGILLAKNTKTILGCISLSKIYQGNPPSPPLLVDNSSFSNWEKHSDSMFLYLDDTVEVKTKQLFKSAAQMFFEDNSGFSIVSNSVNEYPWPHFKLGFCRPREIYTNWPFVNLSSQTLSSQSTFKVTAIGPVDRLEFNKMDFNSVIDISFVLNNCVAQFTDWTQGITETPIARVSNSVVEVSEFACNFVLKNFSTIVWSGRIHKPGYFDTELNDTIKLFVDASSHGKIQDAKFEDTRGELRLICEGTLGISDSHFGFNNDQISIIQRRKPGSLAQVRIVDCTVTPTVNLNLELSPDLYPGKTDPSVSGNNFTLNSQLISTSAYSTDSDHVSTGSGIVVQEQGGNTLQYDATMHVIQRITSGGRCLMRFGRQGSDPGEFDGITALAVNDTGEIYVADGNNQRIQKFDAGGGYITHWGQSGSGPGQFLHPAGIAIQSTATQETILVSDDQRHALLRFTNTGTFLEELSGTGTALGEFNAPSGLTVDADGRYAYLADTNNDRIQKIDLEADATEIPRFKVECMTYDNNNPFITGDSDGFAPANTVTEGEYFRVVVTPLLADGSLDNGFTAKSSGGRIYMDPLPVIAWWEGIFNNDSSSTASDNGATYTSSFTNAWYHQAHFVRSNFATPERTLFVQETNDPKFIGQASFRWVAEDTPPGLVLIGENPARSAPYAWWGGYRQYRCVQDPTVTFVKIPACTYSRGDGTYGPSALSSSAKIYMSTYYIAETPTTNAQFQRWRQSPGAPLLVGQWSWAIDDPSGTKAQDYPEHPAVFIDFMDAKNYSYWLLTGQNSGQSEMFLPSESQLEKAMDGPNISSWGPNRIWPEMGSYTATRYNEGTILTLDERPLESPGGRGTTPVTKYSRQGVYNLYDISGNVHVWSRDLYTTPYDGTAGYKDPVISSGTVRVSKGGSWMDTNPDQLRNAYRNGAELPHPANTVGIRPCFYWPLK